MNALPLIAIGFLLGAFTEERPRPAFYVVLAFALVLWVLV